LRISRILLSLFVFSQVAFAGNFVRISPSGKYFQLEDGTSFVPIGSNEAMNWPEMMCIYPNHGEYNPPGAEHYFQMLRKHGVNCIRIMAEAANTGIRNGGAFLEEPVGEYVQDTVAFLDGLFELATQHHIYVILTPFDTFWMDKKWDQHPYNAVNGGPAHSREEFLTSEAVFKCQQERMRSLIDRFGNSDFLFAWEILNEVDMRWGATPEQQRDWTARMAKFVREYEKTKWGTNHLITVSLTETEVEADSRIPSLLLDNPFLDFVTTHIYYPQGRAPVDPIQPALEFGRGIRRQLEQIEQSVQRPFFASEFGPVDLWPLPDELDDELFHNMSWAHLATGAAGAGLRWPYRWHHILSEGMRESQLGLSLVASKIPWSTFAARNVDERLSVSTPDGQKVHPVGCGDEQQFLIWLVRESNSKKVGDGDTQLVLKASSEGSFQVRVFDTRTGKKIQQSVVKADSGKVTVVLPSFDKDIALIVKAQP